MSAPVRDGLLEWLERQPGHTYTETTIVAKAFGWSDELALVALGYLFEFGDVMKASNDDGETWTWRAVRPPCESIKREGLRSWRCGRESLHSGRHLSSGGGRAW